LAPAGSPFSTLTATVSWGHLLEPTGTVSFVDTSNNYVLGTAALNTLSALFSLSFFEASQVQASVAQEISVVDLTGNGQKDLAVSGGVLPPYSGLPQFENRVLLGNGDGTFTVATQMIPLVESWQATVGDFTEDGEPDLATVQWDGPVTVLLGNGDGTFTAYAAKCRSHREIGALRTVSRVISEGNMP